MPLFNWADAVSAVVLRKGEARRAIEQGGAYLNNLPVEGIARTVTLADLATPSALVLRKGKKSYCVVRIEG